MLFYRTMQTTGGEQLISADIDLACVVLKAISQFFHHHDHCMAIYDIAVATNPGPHMAQAYIGIL